MKTLSNLVTERELLDFSQHFAVSRNYMGSALFPDRKTQYIEQEYTRFVANGNLPAVAKVHAWDTEAAIGSRIPFEKVSVEELLIKEKINLSENMKRMTRGMQMQDDSLRRYIFDDVARMAERVVTRAELAKMQALSTGKLAIRENGLDFEVDYGVPAENVVKSDWSAPDADILGDVRKWRLALVANGAAPTVAVTTEAVMLSIMTNKAVQKAIFGTAGEGTLPTVEQVNALFRSQFGIAVQTNEQRYGVLASDGKAGTAVEQRRFFPEGAFVMTALGPDGTLGAGLWGVTPEEAEQGGAFDEKRQQQFVTVTTWDTPDPVATWTKASAVFVPVMPNPYGHLIATVSAAAEG